MKKLNIVFCSFPDFSGNSKTLYDYFVKNYKEQYNLVWAIKEKNISDKLKKQKIKNYLIGSTEYFKIMDESDVIFSTHANITGEKNSHSIYIELWHGIGLKPVGFLSNNLSNDDNDWYITISRKIDYMIVPSHFWVPLFSAMFNINAQRILPIGMPILDTIKKSKGKENLSKILKRDVNNYKKIIYYMPTFKKGCGRKQEAKINIENVINLEYYDEKILIKYLEDNNYLLVIKPHPSEELNIIKELKTNNIRYILEKNFTEYNLNVNDILNAGDILITDYSSLGILFDYIKKPSIFLTTNEKEYSKNRGIIFNNTEFWMGDSKVKNIKDLILKIENISYNSNYHNLYYEIEKSNCKNIVNYFFKNGKLRENINRNNVEYNNLKQKIDNLKNEIAEKNKNVQNLEKNYIETKKELYKVYSSKSWKIVMFLRKIFNRK